MRLGELIGRMHRAAVKRLTVSIAKTSSRSFLELRAIRAIEREDIRTQSALAERLLRDAPAISRLVDRLERDGLIRRTKGEDRRSVRLEVTAAGRREIGHLDAALDEMESHAQALLGAKELRQLTLVLERVIEDWTGLPTPTTPRRPGTSRRAS